MARVEQIVVQPTVVLELAAFRLPLSLSLSPIQIDGYLDFIRRERKRATAEQ